MTAAVELADRGARQPGCVQRQVREGHDFIVAALIEGERPGAGQSCPRRGRQRAFLPAPEFARAPVRRGDDEQAGDLPRRLAIAEILQQYGAAYGVAD